MAKKIITAGIKAVSSVEAAETALRSMAGVSSTMKGNRISLRGVSMCRLFKALANAGVPKLLAFAFAGRLGLPVSPSTIQTQYNAANGVAVGEATNGHGTVEALDSFDAELVANIKALIKGLSTVEPAKLTALMKSVNRNGDGTYNMGSGANVTLPENW